jgi:hypothetical protein
VICGFLICEFGFAPSFAGLKTNKYVTFLLKKFAKNALKNLYKIIVDGFLDCV